MYEEQRGNYWLPDAPETCPKPVWPCHQIDVGSLQQEVHSAGQAVRPRLAGEHHKYQREAELARLCEASAPEVEDAHRRRRPQAQGWSGQFVAMLRRRAAAPARRRPRQDPTGLDAEMAACKQGRPETYIDVGRTHPPLRFRQRVLSRRGMPGLGLCKGRRQV